MKTGEKEISDYCRTCGECCRIKGFVFISEDEAQKIADFLRIDIYSFTEKYCEIIERKKMALKDKRGKNDCIFLENNGCLIYDVRPTQCANFPFNWTNGNLPEKCIYGKIE